MKKQSFIKGAMILLVAGIINKLLAFVPRVILPRIIGAEGVGLYQLSYPFLVFLLTFITGGIPLAIAKWIAEAITKGEEKRVKHIFRTAMLLSMSIAVVLTILMLWFAPLITKYILPDERVYRSFFMMAPMLIIVAISAVFRGYFQGLQNMIPTAISQISETVVRIVFTLLFAYLFLPFGLEWAAAGAMLGVTIGELAGLIIYFWKYVSEKRSTKKRLRKDQSLPATTTTNLKDAEAKANEPRPKVLPKLLSLSIPVTASRLVGSLSYLFESIFIARSLALAGVATKVATAQYGALQGMVMPLLLLPTALTQSLAVSLVPSLSEAAARGDTKLILKRLHQSMRLALVTGAPFVVVMALFAEPLCRILYAHAEYAPMLQMIAPIGIFVYLQAPLQAALQALDKPGTALKNTLIGAVVKLFLIVQLASQPSLGIYGALIAIGINTVLVTLLHGFSLMRHIGFKMNILDFLKVGAAMMIMGATAKFMHAHLPLTQEWIILIIASTLGIILYLFLMVVMKIIDRFDMVRIPLIGRWFQ
ncbi:stage V sporulation protein B [Paenibacillus yanchengensis]|uniref:Stage V sporulation protein B n=1 Tax=Paenibacillus yanchengensis TaxID=2035833 RepID=A0ABW4YLA6_9BACL